MARQANRSAHEIRTLGIQPTVAACACPFASHEVTDVHLDTPPLQGSGKPEI